MIWVAEAELKCPRLAAWLSDILTVLVLLLAENPYRVLHREKKEDSALYNQIAWGVVHQGNTAGLFIERALASVWK